MKQKGSMQEKENGDLEPGDPEEPETPKAVDRI